MPTFPISPLSPDLTLVKPIGASETRLGPIPNVGDGIPGIGGITSVEVPGVGVLSPGSGGFTIPQAPSLPPIGINNPFTVPAPTATGTPSPVVLPAPEVTPFAGLGPQPTTTPVPGTTTVPQPTASSGLRTQDSGLQAPQQGSPYATQPITTTDLPTVIQTPVMPNAQAVAESSIPVKQTPLAQTFGKYLQDAASNYNDAQTQADSMIQRLATGDKVDIHDVSLALQKASLTSELTIQVRNRLVESYQEIMRMQM